MNATIEQLTANARRAMQEFRNANQIRVDEAVTAVAWALYNDDNATLLAELAVCDTGLGNVTDKITKNKRKTFGTLRDLSRVRTVGIIGRTRRPWFGRVCQTCRSGCCDHTVYESGSHSGQQMH